MQKKRLAIKHNTGFLLINWDIRLDMLLGSFIVCIVIMMMMMMMMMIERERGEERREGENSSGIFESLCEPQLRNVL